MNEASNPNTYVTSLSFSSKKGGHSILAIGRNDGHLSLWSLYDSDGTRFQSQQPSAISCVAFKPTVTRRLSERFGSWVLVEELLVGDEAGLVYYYSIEWMDVQQIHIHGWHGAMTLMAKINVHSQQICGLAWSHDGEYFATGANDNACCLFEVREVLNASHEMPIEKLASKRTSPPLSPEGQAILRHEDPLKYYTQLLQNQTVLNKLLSPRQSSVAGHITGHAAALRITEGRQKHKWIHSAAIKAIAFCPWQRALLATGGGSNDRAIHFYHIYSGACLATIDVQAQVTSLIWSTSRREIAATFGYAQPEHPYRIAVFSWPDCQQVVAIPWASDMRALLAISYPGGPNEASRQAQEGDKWWSRTAEEGCIVVASSDESVKFHEIWSGSRKSTTGQTGLLGGSAILESFEGIEREGAEVIR